MKIEHLIDSEIEQWKDYLFSDCSEPLENASTDLKELLNGYDEFDVRSALKYACKDAYACSTVPSETPFSVWFNVGDIEVMKEDIEPDELDDVTVIGDYAYIYVGYGIMIEFDESKLHAFIDDLEG